MSEQTQVVQKNASSLSPALLAKLRENPILSSLRDDQVQCLDGAKEIMLEKGDLLLRQGELAHNFWFLIEGQIDIYQTMPDGREVTMSAIPPGTAFGELPLLSNIPNPVSMRASQHCELLQLSEEGFWNLMTVCPEVRKAILENMAKRLQRVQSVTLQQEKMASLGTMAAGLMHELNNPGAAARRAASQLRQNLMRMHELTAKFTKSTMSAEQKQCMFDLQDRALSAKELPVMSSLEQSDAEEQLAEWMEAANVENAWKLAPTLVAIGIDAKELECAQQEFPGESFSDALSWLDALASSMQLVGTIEESIGRVTDLVHAVKSYAYEGKGKRQSININESIHAALMILRHKFREKEITLQKSFAMDLPELQSECTGLNQIWTNLLDNAIDAVPPRGEIRIRTWAETSQKDPNKPQTELCILIADNGSGIPLESQPQVFDTFYTTKPMGVGTGMGLGIVQRIVEQYGGSIHFSSQPGNTEFVVRLPAENA